MQISVTGHDDIQSVLFNIERHAGPVTNLCVNPDALGLLSDGPPKTGLMISAEDAFGNPLAEVLPLTLSIQPPAFEFQVSGPGGVQHVKLDKQARINLEGCTKISLELVESCKAQHQGRSQMLSVASMLGLASGTAWCWNVVKLECTATSFTITLNSHKSRHQS